MSTFKFCLFAKRLYKEKLFVVMSLLASQMNIRELTENLQMGNPDCALCIEYAHR